MNETESAPNNCELIIRRYRTIYKHTKDPLYRNSYYLMANTIITSALGFVFWKIITLYFSDADVGLAMAIISAIGLLALFSKLGFDTVIMRFLSRSEKPIGLINSCLTIPVITSLIIATIFVIGINVWSPALIFIRDNFIFAGAFILFTAFFTLSSIIDSIFIAKRRAGFVLSKNTIISILKIVLPFILVNYFHSFGIVSSQGMATAIVAIIYFLFILPKVQSGYKPMFRIHSGAIQDVKRYSIATYIISLLGAAPTYIIPILIVNLLNAEDNAYYTMASMIAGVFAIIPGSVAQSLFAEGSHFEDQLEKNMRRSYKFIFLLLIPAILALLLCGKWLLIAFGASYSENGLLLLRILAISCIFTGINSSYITVLLVKRRLAELTAITVFSSVSLLITVYLVIPITGIVGIGYGIMATNGIISAYVIIAIKRLQYHIAKRNA